MLASSSGTAIRLDLPIRTAPGAMDLWKEALATMDAKDRRILHTDYSSRVEILHRLLYQIEVTKLASIGNRWMRQLRESIIQATEVTDLVMDDGLPWAWMLPLLQAAMGSKSLESSVLESLALIADAILRSYSIRQELTNDQDDHLQNRLVKVLFTLYTAILEFAASSLRRFSGSAGKRMTLSLSQGYSYSRALEAIIPALEDFEREVAILEFDIRKNGRVLSNVSVSVRTKEAFHAIESNVAVFHDEALKVQQTEINRWLSKVPYAMHHQVISRDILEGSGDWLFSRDQFNDWEGSSTSSGLWLHGIPGSGKTFLTAILINRLLAQIQPEEANIAYFYCARDTTEPERSDALEILRCLVKQLSWPADRSSVSAPALAIYEKKKKDADGREPWRLNTTECVNLILNLLETRPAFIVLDAVDECDWSIRNSLLDSLSTIISKSRQPVKIAIFSRQESDIQLALSDWPSLDISKRDSNKDIYEYVQAEVRKAISDKRLLGGHVSELLMARIVATLVDNAQGLFRFASVQIQSISSPRIISEQQVLETLGRLPRSLREVYDTVLDEIKSLPRVELSMAECAIKWLLGAQRPLSSRELICAISGIQSSDKDLVYNARIRPQQLMDMLANLIVFEPGADIFRFVHFSVKEYFDTLADFRLRECHRTILERCLQVYTIRNPALSEDIKQYAACHWPLHLQLATKLPTGDLSPILDRFFFDQSAPYLAWFEEVAEEVDLTLNESLTDPSTWEAMNMNLSAARKAKALGLTLDDFMTKLQESRSHPQTPMFILCAFGILGALASICGLDLLRNHGFDLNQKNQGGLTPLAVALSHSDVDTGDVLFQLGADLNAQNEDDIAKGTLLHMAAKNQDFTVLDFLLQHNAKLEAKNLDDQTPLNLASCEGSTNIVKYLLDAGASTEEIDIDGFTPLLSSARRGHAAVAGLLVKGGANFKAHDPYRGRGPLHWAAVYGNTSVISTLLELKCEIDAKDYQDSTPIILSFEHEHDDVASLLLAAGANLRSSSKEDLTLLEAALQVPNAPRISDYVPASELGAPGFMSEGREETTTAIIRNRILPKEAKDHVLLKKSFKLRGAGPKIEQFLKRERYLLWKLRHPNIVEFRHFEVDKDHTVGHLYMEYCENGDLQRFVDAEDDQYLAKYDVPDATANPLDLIDIWKIISDIAAALAYCHYGMLEEDDGSVSLMLKWHPVLHRDIKAANIVHIRNESGQMVAKLCDLGFAKLLDDTQSTSSTPAVRPPEVTKHWTTKGDIYCLGVTILALNAVKPNARRYDIEKLDSVHRELHALMQEWKKSEAGHESETESESGSELGTESEPPSPTMAFSKRIEDINRIIMTLMQRCGKPEPKPQLRPSSLTLLQMSRKALEILPGHGELKRVSSVDFPFLVMTKYLSMLFHSLAKSYPDARPDWITRLILYWEDFGHIITWTEVEKGLLDVILKMAFEELKRKYEEGQAKENEKRKSRGHSRPLKPFRTLVSTNVDPDLRNICRWKNYGLSPVELKGLVSLAISEVELEI